ncbi:MAG: hypothetical protein HYY13_03750 [Nitrospirae bacterium]|nr:hypothetical protein [Nitrospirota bacterium]
MAPSPRPPRALTGLFTALCLVFGCSQSSGPCRDEGSGTGPDALAERGYCLLEKGYHEEARDTFERAVETDPSHAPARFGAAFTDFFLIVNGLYAKLWEISFDQAGSFSRFQSWLIEDLLGGSPTARGRLATDIEHLRLAAADPALRRNLKGAVLRLNQLEVYLDFIEVDPGEAHAFAAILSTLAAVADVLAAYDLDVPVSYMLNPGEPIYSLFKLDIEGAMNDPAYPRFLTLRADGKEWMHAARAALEDASTELVSATAATMEETDNQSIPDLPDYPDLVSRPYFTLDGTFFIPGIFGPSPATAVLQMLFQEDRKGVISLISQVFPGSPTELPDAQIHILDAFATSLRGERPFNMAGVEVPLYSFFENPPHLRTLLDLLQAAEPVTPGAAQPIPWSPGADINRADPNALPWEHPEKYEPVPLPSVLETQRMRGVDGPAAEIHVGNGELMAGFTREGRLKNLFFPSTTSYNLVPYITRVTHPYLETEPLPFMGANEEHGSFPGLRINGSLTWPMRWLDHRHINPGDPSGRKVLPRYEEDGIPVARITYEPPVTSIRLEETAFVPLTGDGHRLNVLVRDFVIRNTSTSPQSVNFLYYGAFNVTNIDQYILGPKFWIAWLFSPNRLIAEPDGSLLWNGPGWSGHPKGEYAALRLSGETSGSLLRRSIGRLTREGDTGAWEHARSGASHTEPLEGVSFGNGYLEWDLGTLDPGANARVTVMISLGAGATPEGAASDAQAQERAVREAGIETVHARTREHWRNWLASNRTPDGEMSKAEKEMFERSAMALKLDHAALTGALPEMWDMQPMWFMVWPGNGIWHAAALDALGHPDEARAYLDYLARIQSPDGHWRMAYTALGDPHGAFELEYYATASIVWYAWAHWKLTGDNAWLRGYWPTVERAADFLVSRVAQNGLLYASADFVEDLTSIRQSLFTNSIAVSALNAASEMADLVGSDRRSRYRRSARDIHDAMIETFWIPREQRFHAFQDMHGRHGLDTPPVFAWPFHAFRLDDKRVAAYAATRLDPATLAQDYLSFVDSGDWSPGLIKNALFYVNHFNATGRPLSRDLAQSIVDGLLQPQNLTLAGFIAERFFGYGVKGSGKPLLWPHSLFVLHEFSKSGTSPLPLIEPLE